MTQKLQKGTTESEQQSHSSRRTSANGQYVVRLPFKNHFLRDYLQLNHMSKISPQELTTILARWRRDKVAFRADIEKIYRQITVLRDYQNFQRIVWREDIYKPIEHFRLRPIKYGTAAKLYLAVKTIFQLADDGQMQYPQVGAIVKTDMYVDDLMSCADDVRFAIELQRQIFGLWQSAVSKMVVQP